MENKIPTNRNHRIQTHTHSLTHQHISFNGFTADSKNSILLIYIIIIATIIRSLFLLNKNKSFHYVLHFYLNAMYILN